MSGFEGRVRRISCAVYDKFGSRYKEAVHRAVASPFTSSAVGVQLLRLSREGGTWLVEAPALEIRQHPKSWWPDFQDPPEWPVCRAGECVALPAPKAPEVLYVDFTCCAYTARHTRALQIVVAPLDAKGKLVPPLLSAGTPVLPGMLHRGMARCVDVLGLRLAGYVFVGGSTREGSEP